MIEDFAHQLKRHLAFATSHGFTAFRYRTAVERRDVRLPKITGADLPVSILRKSHHAHRRKRKFRRLQEKTCVFAMEYRWRYF